MKATALFVLALAWTAFFVGCGDSNSQDSNGQEVGCDWFAGDNCWKSTIDAAKNCLPADDAYGTLSADGTTCDYDGGIQVVFNNPYDSTALDNDTYIWDFEVKASGSTCLAYKEFQSGGMELSTSAGTFKQNGSAAMEITCPDGSQYSANGFKLLSCEQGLSILPGTSYSWQPDSVLFSFLGVEEGSQVIFNCSR